jgi:predicted Zn-dependent protease with MMP-like domain
MPLRRRGSLARRHPCRRIALPATERPPDAFERLVEEALEALPSEIRRLLDDVAVVIADEPTPAQLRDGTDDDGWLYGLYEGTPRVEYAADQVAFPNKITLFRLPLEEDFPHPADLADEVRRTVAHELAHHVGFPEERLRELGLE